MIAPEQLSAALTRLDPRDWEVLDLSLRRRVPDDALGEVLRADPAEVARRRAGAIERLSNDLGIQRGEDLGAVLKSLLAEGTWLAAEKGGPAPAPRRAASPQQAPVRAAAPSGPAPPKSAPPKSATPASPRAPEPGPQSPPPPKAEPRADGDGTPPGGGPVLDMLSPDRGGGGRRRLLGIAGTALAGLLLLAGGGAAAVLMVGDGEGAEEQGSAPRTFVPQSPSSLGTPFPSSPQVDYSYQTAAIRKTTTLYDHPGGRRKLRISPRTEWDTPRILSVVRQRGPWLAVLVPELPNGEVAWLPEQKARLGSVNWSLHADLSKRRLEVRRDGEAVHRFRVAIGAPNHPTPKGRFAVTDKLKVADKASVYGCCVVALTGHQTRLPRTWPGGDRLAIHSTRNIGGIGHAVSLGCMRVTSGQARWLIRKVPIGTPVFIRG